MWSSVPAAPEWEVTLRAKWPGPVPLQKRFGPRWGGSVQHRQSLGGLTALSRRDTRWGVLLVSNFEGQNMTIPRHCVWPPPGALRWQHGRTEHFHFGKLENHWPGGSQITCIPAPSGTYFWVTFVKPLPLSGTPFQTENKVCVSLEGGLHLSCCL